MLGEQVSHYKVIGELGGGGMGVVYRALDTRLGRQVAIKFLSPRAAEQAGSLERFRREARAAGALNHPNLCAVYDLGEHQGQPYLVLELLEGETLQKRLESGALSVAEWLQLALDVAGGLEAAHSAGIVHRDLKPANIFLTRHGHAKILDFGLAKPGVAFDDDGTSPTRALESHDLTVAAGSTLTQAGSTLGTLAYMSPEQASGEAVDGRTDLFSLGAVLHEAGTGRRLFHGNTPPLIFDAIFHRIPTAIAGERSDWPRILDEVLGRLLAKDRTKRTASAAELRSELKAIARRLETIDSGLLAAFSTSVGIATGARRRRVGLALGAAALVLAILAGGWLLWPRAPVAEADFPFASAAAAQPATAEGGGAIAVLPFRNLSGDASLDYLEMALPDLIAAQLGTVPHAIVRPFFASARFRDQEADLAAAGSELRAGYLVVGQLTQSAEKQAISLELVDVRGDRVLWRSRLEPPVLDPLALRSELMSSLFSGLLPALGLAAPAALPAGPHDSEAYAAYMRTYELGHEGEENRRAIAELREILKRDDTLAEAWEALAERLYQESRYATYGPLHEVLGAARRALDLDPNRLTATQLTIICQVESGDLLGAWNEVRRWMQRRPDQLGAYFSRAYVLRYAGELEEALADCETARRSDPDGRSFRSCYMNGLRLGREKEARLFAERDAGGDWYQLSLGWIELYAGNEKAAKAAWSSLGENQPVRRLSEACLVDRDPAAIARALAGSQRAEDPEQIFFIAMLAVHCGALDEGVKWLGEAISRGYCGTPDFAISPLLAPLRADSRFAVLERQAEACRESFRAGRRR